MDKRANNIYRTILDDIVYPRIGNSSTFMSDLKKEGGIFFPSKFHGVYPSDKIPKLKPGQYAILNTDNSKGLGEHWIAVAKIDNHNTVCYDSFGRHNKDVISTLSKSGNGKITDTDRDAEQIPSELDCGARCLAFLIVLDNWGYDLAKLI